MGRGRPRLVGTLGSQRAVLTNTPYIPGGETLLGSVYSLWYARLFRSAPLHD